MIRPHPPTFADDEAFRFRHVLIRDAAYDALPKAARAELHERFASWLEEHVGVLLGADEIAGWHLEQAVRYTARAGRRHRAGGRPAPATHLHAAGRRADHRSDIGASRNLLERALAWHRPTIRCRRDRGRPRRRPAPAGELDRANELLAGSEQATGGDPLAGLYRLELQIHTRPDEASETIESLLPKTLSQLERSGDERALAKAHLAA